MATKNLALFMATIIVLAGCVGGDAGSPASEPGSDQGGPIRPEDIQDSEFGAVVGTILDDEGVPVDNASVALQKTDFTATTDGDGVFGIRDVPPGTYVLVVGKLGYQSAARSFVVSRGEITQAAILLTSVEAPGTSYFVVSHFTGWYDCALATAVWISACSYPYTAAWGSANESGVNLSKYGAPMDIQRNVFRFNFTVKQNVSQVIGEMAWTSASAAATRMSLMFLCGDYDYVLDDCLDANGDSVRYGNQTSGPSPLRKVVDREEFLNKSKDEDGKSRGKWDLEKNPQIWVMNYAGLPFGCLPRDYQHPETLVPGYVGCANGLPSSEAQVAFQQKFEVWDSVFYVEPAPAGYTVLTADQ